MSAKVNNISVGAKPLFELNSTFTPKGDQPQAITELVEGIQSGRRHQTLLGVTGSGKTFTIANVIAACDRPVLVISHNKTLAAQLYGEFKAFSPTTPWNSLSVTMTITSPRPIYLRRIPISKKILP